VTALAHSGAHGAGDRAVGDHTADEPTLPPLATWLPVEPCPQVTPPGPVLAPYLGLVSAVLCALGGGWLLLAPYALDYLHGAERTPRTTEIDLGTGAAVVALAIVSALLFAMSLARHLRGPEAVEREAEREPVAGPEFAADPLPIDGEAEPSVLVRETAAPQTVVPEPAESAGARESAPESAPEPPADPGSALRDLLTPLVAALAADLKSRSDHPEGSGPR